MAKGQGTSALQNLFDSRARILAGQRNDSDNDINIINNTYVEGGEIYELNKNQDGTFSNNVYFRIPYQHQPFLIYI